MPTIRMPRLGDDIEEAAVVRWLKQDGEIVKAGEPIAEVETEKANVELEADADGPFRTLVEPGQSVPVGTGIATIGEVDMDIPATNTAIPRSDGSEMADQETGVDLAVHDAATVTSTPLEPPGPSSERVRSSPSARQLARELDVDIRSVIGSGPHGRIVRDDVERAARSTAGGPSHPQDSSSSAAPSGGPATGSLVPLSASRAATARRMAKSKQIAPHFYLTAEVRMDAAIRLIGEVRSTTPITVTHLVLRAVAAAATEHPRLNASFTDEGVLFHDTVDIGLAVALDDGLVSPAILDCGPMSLGELANRATDLVGRARRGKLSAAELSGGTITVSNLGMYGIDEFVAILDPPQAAIIAVGAVIERPVVDGDSVAIGRTMRITCSADHRVLNGAEVARFMASVKGSLEQPASLMT